MITKEILIENLNNCYDDFQDRANLQLGYNFDEFFNFSNFTISSNICTIHATFTKKDYNLIQDQISGAIKTLFDLIDFQFSDRNNIHIFFQFEDSYKELTYDYNIKATDKSNTYGLDININIDDIFNIYSRIYDNICFL